MIDHANKELVTKALNEWLLPDNPERSANALTRRTGVNASYISNIKNGNYTIGQTMIKPAVYFQIADAIGLNLTKPEAHWETPSYLRITAACKKAQIARKIVLLDSMDSGVGKTYTLEMYSKTNDKVVYVKCTSTMTAADLLSEVMTKLLVKKPVKGNKAKMDEIRLRVTGTPGYLIIIDETDDIKAGLWKFIKEMYDFTRNRCGMIVSGMGTTDKINRLADRNRDGFKQLRRRLFSNRIMISLISKTDIQQIAKEELGINAASALRWFSLNVSDYQMLAEYIGDLKAAFNAQELATITDRNLDEFFNAY
jgi:DNA transposition AAA+ family ATPase